MHKISTFLIFLINFFTIIFFIVLYWMSANNNEAFVSSNSLQSPLLFNIPFPKQQGPTENNYQINPNPKNQQEETPNEDPLSLQNEDNNKKNQENINQQVNAEPSTQSRESSESNNQDLITFANTKVLYWLSNKKIPSHPGINPQSLNSCVTQDELIPISNITSYLNPATKPWESFPNQPEHQCAYPPLEFPKIQSDNGLVCIIVRSYSEHLKQTNYNLRRLLTCLEQMEYTNWNAIFFSSDLNPIDNIIDLLIERNPIYHEKYFYLKGRYKSYETWEAGYNLTDWAINFCPKESKWLLVTNGDNEYSPKTLSYLDGNIDACSFDFFTRYTKFPWMRYHKSFHDDAQIFPNKYEICANKASSCVHNGLAEMRTDLGSTIWNFHRWKAENITYSKFSPLRNNAQDGSLTEYKWYNGWIFRVLPYCFFSHNPNEWTKCRHNFP